MKPLTVQAFIAFALLCFWPGAFSQVSSMETARVTNDELKWVARATGVQLAVLTGDDTKAGVYAYRARFPQGFKAQPHSHPDDRIGNVISGTLYVGYGEQFDESKMKVLPAGSTWTEPSRQPHFVWAKDGEVIIQIVGNGPSASIPVQPK